MRSLNHDEFVKCSLYLIGLEESDDEADQIDLRPEMREFVTMMDVMKWDLPVHDATLWVKLLDTESLYQMLL